MVSNDRAAQADANCRFTVRQALLFGGGLLLGGVAGRYAEVAWGTAATELATSNASCPALPPTPPAWNTSSAPVRAAWRRERVERALPAILDTTSYQSSYQSSTTDAPPRTDDVTITELDNSCVTERANLSAADILRQIARTLRSPLSSLAIESQVVYFQYQLDRCPTPVETARLRGIFGAVDIVMGRLVALLPGAQTSVLLQGLGPVLLRAIADDLDGLAPDPDNASDATQNLAFLARSMVAAAPRDAAGKVIAEKLAPPANTRFEKAGPVTEIDGVRWRLSFNDGRFVATSNGRVVDVDYSREIGGWELHEPETNPETLQVRPLSHTREQLDADIAARLAVVASVRQPAGHEGTGTLYNVQTSVRTSGMGAASAIRLLCASIHGHLVPVRLFPDGVSYEAYDAARPSQVGFPVRPDNNQRWVFGRPVEPLAKGSGQPTPTYASDLLGQKIPRSWIVADIDQTHLSSPDTRGILRLSDDRWYLPVSDGVVPIRQHVLHPDLFEIGPPDSDKVLCVFDRDRGTFRLSPEEKVFAPVASEDAKWFDAVGAAMMAQERVATRFALQRQKTSYREGFRTWEAKDFPNIVLTDTKLATLSESIPRYGLNRDELSTVDAYTPVARKWKAAMLNSAARVHTLRVALYDPTRAPRLFDRLFNLIGSQPDADGQDVLKSYFMSQVEAIDRLMVDHIDTGCDRVWLVKFTSDDVLGMTFMRDPLKRIFVNVGTSGASQEQAVACGAICEDATRSDDLATILHEASHLAAHTEDIFYMTTPDGPRALASEVQRLAGGRLRLKEAQYLLRLAREHETSGRSKAEILSAATNLFNTRPQVRAGLLMNNADSLAQIVLELSGGGGRRRRVRDARAPAREMRALLSALAARVQWQAALGAVSGDHS